MDDDRQLLGLLTGVIEHFNETLNHPVEGIHIIVENHQMSHLTGIGIVGHFLFNEGFLLFFKKWIEWHDDQVLMLRIG
jgi:hypothetical protein